MPQRTNQQSPNDPIKLLLDDLATKTGAVQFGTAEEPRFFPSVAASLVNVGFSDAVPLPVVSANTLANLYFESDTLRKAVYENSAYLKAGVQLAVIEDPNAQSTREIIYANNTFCSSESLNFEFLEDGEELTNQHTPFAFQQFKIAEESSLGATFQISRRDMKDTPQYALHGLMLDAIASGIGKAIDKAMATHMSTLTVTPFTLAAVAARGLSMGDIRGITSGSSENAKLEQGELYLSGVKADLCAGIGSYIFAPKKFAVAVPQDLRITAKRLTNGATELTIWTNVEVLATSQTNSAVWAA